MRICWRRLVGSLGKSFFLSAAPLSAASPSGRRRLLAAVLITDGSPQVANPLLCSTPSDTVIFRLFINATDRTRSHFPVYLKDHLYNTNPKFDYAPFVRLRYIVESTKTDLNNFAYVFGEKGTYVFGDSQVRLVCLMYKYYNNTS